jgi:hypothetical protein
LTSPRTLNDGKLTISDIVATLFARNISWRVYGPNKEYRRPMIHRYPCNSGYSVLDTVAENVTKSNALLKHLMKKGKS